MIERLLIALAACLLALPGQAARESKISQTKHNLSSTGVGTVKSATESQICVFCHTPHGADASAAVPLWNKTIQDKTYTPYSSSSLDAKTIQGASAGHPLGSSKLCLSCHDGAMQLGSVRVLRGQQNQTISVDNTASGAMPGGQGDTTGFTRQLGGATYDDLSNDHPISVTYDTTLAARDGELRTPDSNQRNGTVFGKLIPGDQYRPMLPLAPTGSSNAGQVQCTTCHDPHIRETSLTNERNIKFLRANRFQLEQPTSTYSAINDIICLACHDKGMQGDGTSWAYSAHANKDVATQTYKTGAGTAAEIREFPDNIPVWKASCLNCHDTHTVTGARRLLREGVDTAAVGGIKSGGNAALEEVCYQCHRDSAASILNSVTSVPNIRGDFQLTYRMPITATDQKAGQEMHDIGGNFSDGFAGVGTTGSDCSGATNKCGADLVEQRANLGRDNANNRHAECTDCHNPHRVVRFRLFFGAGAGLSGTPEKEGTHRHTDTNMSPIHTNVASGVLRGSWGVEPSYASNSFHSSASNYTVRRGDPGGDSVTNDSNPDTKGYVTREYQICLKCHSTYGYTTPPNLNPSSAPKGLTPAGTIATPGVGNALTQYTDQAKEFQAPATHADNSYDSNHDGNADYTVSLGTDGGAGYNTHNHRAWHPVMRATGRTPTKRGMGTSTSGWRAPWNSTGAIGNQTMYCSDCHGSNVASSTSVIPDGTDATTGAGNPWGPHGSGNPFILKGAWTKDVTQSTAMCMKCHNPLSGSTGFFDATRGKDNLHSYHNTKISGGLQCTWCHVAIPHGWKNKMFLVNLNDVGEEAGQGIGSSKEVALSASDSYYTQPPYYLEAKLKIRAFSPSGGWDYSNCGSAGKTGGNLIPESKSGRTANNTGNQLNWMTGSSTCSSPP